ncbi:hypothetical protein AC249_AIPGENE20093, partial [Exaiptasia diaphana]
YELSQTSFFQDGSRSGDDTNVGCRSCDQEQFDHMVNYSKWHQECSVRKDHIDNNVN